MTAGRNYPLYEFVSPLLAEALAAAKTIKTPCTKTKLLSQIAASCARFERKNQALEVLSQALEVAKKIEEPAIRAKAMGEVAGLCEVEPQLRERADEILSQALEVAQTVQNNPKGQYEALLEIAMHHANAGQNERALLVVEMIESSSHRMAAKTYILQWITRRHAEAGEHDRAFQMVIESETYSLYDQIFALFSLANNYAKAERPDLAERTLSEALEMAATQENPIAKASRLVLLADEYSRKGHPDTALQILPQALQAARTIEEEHTKDTLLDRIAEAYARAGQPDCARQVLQTIENAESTSFWRVYALLEIGSAYAKAGESARAAAELSQALEVANALQDAGDRADALIDLAATYLSASHMYRSIQVLEQAREVAKTLEYSDKVDRLKSIAFWYREAGLYDKALEVVTEIRHSYARNNSLAHLAPAYINAGQYDQALRVVEMISDAKYKAEGLARIALKCAEAGQRERSFETFSQAVRTAKTIKKRGPKRAVLIQIIRWYMETGKYSHTLETVKAIQDASLEAEMLINWITPKYEEAGLVSKAAQLYAQAERAIERMKNSPEKGMWMARISKIYAKAGQYERALQVARGIKNGQAKVEALLDIAEQYAAAQ